MKVLIVGGGGREHALAWKLRQSPLVEKIFCAPGNAGIAQGAECVPIETMDFKRLVSFAREKEIGLTVVGPEAPLAAGLADLFAEAGLAVFGPSRRAARLEGSKIFAKELMEKNGIPTARCKTFADFESAAAYIDEHGAPVVVKADGLAAGKGVVVAQTAEEAREALRSIMVEKVHGEAGSRVVIEEFLSGEEVSVLAFTDGETVVPMVPSQDHKAVFENDTGPNTGGMGAYSPVPALDEKGLAEVTKAILEPTVAGLRKEGIVFKGVLYAGLMLTADGPKVLEYNVRFGDPECQVVLPRLKSDLAEIMLDVVNGRLEGRKVSWLENCAATVVMASGGYPGPYEKGLEITGLEEAAAVPGTYVFHAGTALKEGKIVTAGGRVLSVSAWGNDLREALDKAYAAVAKIDFAGKHYRRDIGHRALKRLEKQQ